MAFRIAKINPQVLDDIVAWKTQQMKGIDDYVLTINDIPEGINPEVFRQDKRQALLQNLGSAERRYQQALKAKQKVQQLTPEQKAAINKESVADGMSSEEIVAVAGEPTTRVAKAPQGVTQSPPQRGFNPETLLPEGIELDVAIAIAKQNAAKKFPNNTKQQNKQFYKEMEAQGLARDIVGQQWVDNRVLGGWVNGEGGKKTRTIDQSKLEAMRAAYQEPVPMADAPQGVVSEVVQGVPSSSAVPVAEVSTAPVEANATEVVSVPQENITYHNFQTPQTPIATGQMPEASEAEAILNALEQTDFQPQQVVQESVPVSIPIPEGVPASGVNPSADGVKVFPSTGLPMGNSGSMNFEGEQFNKQPYTPPGGTPNHPEIPGMNEPIDPEANLKWLWEQNQRNTEARQQYWQERNRREANTGSWVGNVWDGTKRGFNYSIDAGRMPGRTASAVWNRAPKEQYEYLTPEGRVGFLGGRLAGEIGHGTRQILWNAHPDDFTGTESVKVIRKAGGNRMAQVVVPFATTTALQLGSQTYNPFNLGQGGRVAGYTAINPDEEDPRISTTPFSELVVDRGFFGRRGKLLPWEQFREERPDIPYEQYEKYQKYLWNRDENLLREATGGLVKGTLDGINGPEVSVMGYSVTPVGALAAAGTLLAGRNLVGRTAGLRM